MIFIETKLKGAYIIELEQHVDERGFFARSWCQRELAEHGLDTHLVQCNISLSKVAGTLRGMHYQRAPMAETKLVRCTWGEIYDVIIDLRPTSPTFLQWVSVVLSGENRRMLYVPKGFAHGFQSLVDNTEVFYQMGEFYAPETAAGVRWNDPLFAIAWPLPVSLITAKDQMYADCSPDQFCQESEFSTPITTEMMNGALQTATRRLALHNLAQHSPAQHSLAQHTKIIPAHQRCTKWQIR